ncbi:FliI/YscN family ATPase [Acidithiobacillus ferrooxidans]|uniref:FliI/YscN family ATPase n=1 Tax=Acidithiobacillus ferrooxidans TaxID=920 RepID=UPI001C06640F|nr:FliI/YscN family ATPase [Acidithiobacillus ferrooxidans]
MEELSAICAAQQHLDELSLSLRKTPPPSPAGRVLRVIGTALEASGLSAMVGQYARVETPEGWRLGEVIGFHGDRAAIMPFGGLRGVFAGASVTLMEQDSTVPVGDELLGRVVDAMGRPLDDRALMATQRRPLKSPAPNPLTRKRITRPLDVGVRAINALLTVGEGQRVGLFAGSGVGKSVLLGMIARHTDADIVVIALIGERGREVREFIEDTLGEGLAHAVVVVATADAPPVLRMRGAEYATAVAEHFRDQGKKVLLIMDSLTRYAMAAREVGLAAGELPATKGYPPSAFSALSVLTERAGTAERGAITAFYSVLVEGDDLQDPIADAARAILDGHIVLSREMAAKGIYPALDPAVSASRVMRQVVSAEQLSWSSEVLSWWGRYRDRADLIAIGAYVQGTDPLLDTALLKYPEILRFLSQPPGVSCNFQESLGALRRLAGSTA